MWLQMWLQEMWLQEIAISAYWRNSRRAQPDIDEISSRRSHLGDLISEISSRRSHLGDLISEISSRHTDRTRGARYSWRGIRGATRESHRSSRGPRALAAPRIARRARRSAQSGSCPPGEIREGTGKVRGRYGEEERTIGIVPTWGDAGEVQARCRRDAGEVQARCTTRVLSRTSSASHVRCASSPLPLGESTKRCRPSTVRKVRTSIFC